MNLYLLLADAAIPATTVVTQTGMTPTFDLGHGVLGVIIAALCWLSAHGRGAAEFAKKEVQSGQESLETIFKTGQTTLETLHATGHSLLGGITDQIAAFEVKLDEMTKQLSQVQSQSTSIQQGQQTAQLQQSQPATTVVIQPPAGA